MSVRRVRFEYYEVCCKEKNDKTSSPDRLFDLRRWISKATKKSLEARTFDYRDEQARLDRAYYDLELENWFMHFVRLRDTNIPSKATKQSEVEPFELDDDEYLGEDVSALYDEDHHILMLQRNRYSLGPEGIEEYLNLLWDSDDEYIYLRPIISPNIIKEAEKAEFYRRLNVRFANLDPEKFKTKSDSPLGEFIKTFGKYKGVTAEITVTLGRTRGTSLDRETIHDTLIEIEENKEYLQKAEIAKKDSQDTSVEVIDLIEHKAHDFAYFTLEKRSSLQHETVAYHMWKKYIEEERKSDIIAYLQGE